MKYTIRKYKYLIAFLFVGIMTVVFSVSMAWFIFQKERGVKYDLTQTPLCPYCASSKFPPYGFLSGYSPGVYRCEDCDKVWGPHAIAWLIAHPTINERELLLPPKVRAVGNNIKHDPKHYHAFYLEQKNRK